jgi:uncharacterized membrane protein YhaH (DUF805 family)
MQRRWQTVIVVITAVLMLMENFVKNDASAQAAKYVRNWGIIIGFFALALGTVNLLSIHGRRISDQKSGWFNSLVLITGMTVFAGMGIVNGTRDATLQLLFTNILSPMATAMFGTLIFYIVSSGYRSFVARKAESAVILVTAVFVMLGQIPLGRTISPMIPDIAQWLQDIPNNAGQRGLVIGAAIGAVANGLRVLLGLERNFGG